MNERRPITNPIRELVDDLCALEHGLTEWEAEFVDSIAKQIERTGYISARQHETLQAIGDRRL